MLAMEEGKIDFVVRIKREQGKSSKSKSFRVKFETMCHCFQRNFFFFFENAKIWVGRTTLNREKKGDGLIGKGTHKLPGSPLLI